MRPNFLLVLVLVLTVGFGVAWHFKQTPANSDSPSPSDETNAVSLSRLAKPTSTFAVITSEPPRSIATTSGPEKRAEAIEAEISHLRELAMKADDDALSLIVADLTHPEKEVREVAIESARELGNSNAIPILKAAAQNSEDTQEKIALLEAAEFLGLPQMTFESTPNTRTPEQTRAAEQKMTDRMAQRDAVRDRRKKTGSAPPGTTPGSWSTTNNPPRL